ncbi:MAG: hypothetical protein MUC38_14730 [Cyclobacteriaceae bacterium]|jgi:hypothetical protein|nr:hypothetical protein [Cyclobacteriaceae bacterium]
MTNILVSFLVAFLCVFTPDKLVKVKVNDSITVSLPAELKPMTPEDIALRYPSVRAPLGAFTNPDRVVDFSVNISATQWPDMNHEMAAQFFKASVFHMFDRTQMLEEGIHEIHGQKYIYFKFESRVNGTKGIAGEQPPILKYTYIQYLLGSERTLVFTFTCPREQKLEWQKVSEEVMKSIKIKA